MQDPENAALLKPLRWPLRLTRAGLWGEQVVRAAWPLWTVLLVIWALLAFGVHGMVSRELALGSFALGLIAVAYTTFLAVRRFRWPTQEDAMVRLDASMPGRPITAALDEQAIGSDDPASQAVWEAHKARMRARMETARAVSPDLRVSRMDVFGLRYVALLAFVMALGFGSLWREDGLVDLAPSTNAQALTSGPAWEVWIEPPVYTGKPSLYLNDVKVTELSVPKDSQMTVRLYGEVGSLSLTETVSGTTTDETAQPQTAFSLPVVQDGTISINDEDATAWTITVIDDTPPTVTVTGAIERTPDGEMQLPFEAKDDYGVERGEATIALDLASVDRRHGLALEPEPVAELGVDLPMPFSGNREEFSELLIENLSKHPWATLPVQFTLSVQDGKGQTSKPHVLRAELPGRRFFQPIAKALIEQRRDLLWNRENAPRIGMILRAVTYEPEGFFNSEPAYLTVRRVITRLDLLAGGPLSDEARDEIAEMLWNAAVVLEEGTLNDALEALRRAQEKLADAMRDGASDEEISELMRELQEAMREYMQRLAEQQQQEGQQQQQAENQNSQEITQDQIQDMLDEIERLMQEGEMDQAQALLDQLMEMMENMQVAEGQQGQQGQSPGEQAMEGLQETLRDQQGLSDEAFRDLQEQFNPDAQAGENEGNEGRNGGQGRGQSHEGEGGEGQGQQQSDGQGDQQGGEQGEGSLADRQQALRDELERQQRNLPGAGTPEGDAARDALDRAGEAMERAEDALRDGQTADALGAQSDAMEALREGMRELSQMMAEQQQGQPGGEQQGENSSNRGRDPLGRDAGTDGVIGQDGSVPDDLDARQRSRELLDEIRRRSGEQERPEIEREYLRRLLDRF